MLSKLPHRPEHRQKLVRDGNTRARGKPGSGDLNGSRVDRAIVVDQHLKWAPIWAQ